jgi:hypothetical protein
MGLGAGTIACHAKPESAFTFMELDPAVVEMAQIQFSFLRRCHGRQPNRIIVGDGRLELAKLRDEKFDMIILDAFSSDAVPVHLVSQEAMALYLDRLTQNGVIVFNLSSRYFRLEETIAAGAAAKGLEHRYWTDGRLRDPVVLPSSWMIAGRPAAGLSRLASPPWRAAEPPPGLRPWTDNYSSVATVLTLTGR